MTNATRNLLNGRGTPAATSNANGHGTGPAPDGPPPKPRRRARRRKSREDGYKLFGTLLTSLLLIERLQRALGREHRVEVAGNGTSERHYQHAGCLDCRLADALLGADHFVRVILVELEASLYPEVDQEEYAMMARGLAADLPAKRRRQTARRRAA